MLSPWPTVMMKLLAVKARFQFCTWPQLAASKKSQKTYPHLQTRTHARTHAPVRAHPHTHTNPQAQTNKHAHGFLHLGCKAFYFHRKQESLYKKPKRESHPRRSHLHSGSRLLATFLPDRDHGIHGHTENASTQHHQKRQRQPTTDQTTINHEPFHIAPTSAYARVQASAGGLAFLEFCPENVRGHIDQIIVRSSVQQPRLQ